MAAFTWLGADFQDEIVGLGPLMLIAPLLHKLDIESIIDQHLPADPQLEFPYGKILSLFIAARLCQPNALVNIPNWAEENGADILWNIPSDKLNDDRLGRALDAFFEQRHNIMAQITHHVLRYTELGLGRLHFDTTDVTFYGAYERSLARPLVDFTHSFPSNSRLLPAHITKGYLTDHRMIQVGVTSLVDDLGALPILCHPVDGNRNGHSAIHEQYLLLRQYLPLPQEMQLVSDRGTFSAEHVARLRRHGHHVLCAVPWDDYRAIYDTHSSQLAWQQASYLSFEQQRRRETASTLPQEHYQLAAVPHARTDPETKKPIPCRLLFVYSTSGAKEEHQRRQENIAKIQAGLDDIAAKLLRGHPKTTYQSAVKQVTKLLGNKSAAKYFSWQLVELAAAERQALPAPQNGHKRATYRLTYTYDPAQADADTQYDGLSAILATMPEPKTSDALFSEYKQQSYVELGHHQYKTPLAVRPVFLKSPRRVEALVCLLHIALQVYQVLERRYRQRTPTDAPRQERRRTAESLLRAFQVYGVSLRTTPVGQTLHATRLRTQQRHILGRLGLPTPNNFFAQILPPISSG